MVLKANLTDSCFERVPNDQGGTSCVPLPAEWWPWEFLTVRESTIELRACFSDWARWSIDNLNKDDRARFLPTFSWIGNRYKASNVSFPMWHMEQVESLPISTAPAEAPARIERRALGFSRISYTLSNCGYFVFTLALGSLVAVAIATMGTSKWKCRTAGFVAH